MPRTATRQATPFDLGDEVGSQIASRFFRALGDPTRLRLLSLLVDHEELTVSELVAAVEGMQGRISSHLACLRWCGLVVDRREGRNVYYSVTDARIRKLLAVALPVIADNATHIATCHNIGD